MAAFYVSLASATAFVAMAFTASSEGCARVTGRKSPADGMRLILTNDPASAGVCF